MAKGIWLTSEQEASWRALQMMQMRLGAALARQLSTDSELSYSEYLVLVALADHGEEGRLRLFELGQWLGWESSRISHQISRMSTRGLVEKQRCDDDRRGAFVQITKSGRRSLKAAAPGHVAAVRRLFIEQVTPAQLASVRAAAEAVLSALDGS